MRNLIIGAALGYSKDHITPFIKTLQKTNYKGDVILVVDYDAGGNLLDFLVENEIKYYKAQTFYKYWPKKIVDKRFTKYLKFLHKIYPTIIKFLPIKGKFKIKLTGQILSFFSSIPISRYYYYWNIIIESTYENILLTDIRDVIFQNNPFDGKIYQGLNVAIENEEKTLKADPINSRWIGILYGEKVLEEIGDCNISCSGTTIGDRSSILNYLELMIKEQAKVNYRVPGRQNFDQATHNFLLWTRKIKNANKLQIGSSEVITMVQLKESDIKIQDGYVVNNDGSTVSILHQYDWHKNLDLKVLQ